MRSWSLATSALAAVVIMVRLSTGTPSGAFSHRSHRPAKAKASPPLSVMRQGCFAAPFFSHS